jgi:AraC family transcriptional regulator
MLDIGVPSVEPAATDRCLAASKRFAHVAERALAWARDPSACDVASLARDVLEAIHDEEEIVTVAIGTSDRIEPRVARALRYVEARHADDCSLQVLAAEAGLGVFHFLRSFKRSVGQTPCQHVMAVRLRAAARMLAASDTRVVDVAIEAGFGDLSHFNATFRDVFGMQPSAYRRMPARA